MIKVAIKKILMVLSSLFSRNNDSKIIFYHDIHLDEIYCKESSTSLELFIKHINFIKESGFSLVKKINNSKNQIKIQFDDGFKGVFDCLPFIIENKIPIEIFLIVNKIDTENYLSISQIIEMNNHEFVSFSSHTVSHACLDKLDDIQLKHELEHSKKYLQKILNKEVKSICFPKGLFNDRVVQLAKEIGYDFQYCSIPGSYTNKNIPNVYNRNLVQFSNVNELSLILKGGLSFFKIWFRNKHYKR